MITVIIGIVVVIVIVCAIAGIYNNMVTKRNRIDNAWQNIDTQLQRRNDLIPNLVETVKGYAKHERETFEKVTQALHEATDAKKETIRVWIHEMPKENWGIAGVSAKDLGR